MFGFVFTDFALASDVKTETVNANFFVDGLSYFPSSESKVSNDDIPIFEDAKAGKKVGIGLVKSYYLTEKGDPNIISGVIFPNQESPIPTPDIGFNPYSIDKNNTSKIGISVYSQKGQEYNVYLRMWQESRGYNLESFAPKIGSLGTIMSSSDHFVSDGEELIYGLPYLAFKYFKADNENNPLPNGVYHTTFSVDQYIVQPPSTQAKLYDKITINLTIDKTPADITVNNLNDSGDGSLRDALDKANDNDKITFNDTLKGQKLILKSTLNINKPIKLYGRNINITTQAPKAHQAPKFGNVLNLNTGGEVLINALNFSEIPAVVNQYRGYETTLLATNPTNDYDKSVLTVSNSYFHDSNTAFLGVSNYDTVNLINDNVISNDFHNDIHNTHEYYYDLIYAGDYMEHFNASGLNISYNKGFSGSALDLLNSPILFQVKQGYSNIKSSYFSHNEFKNNSECSVIFEQSGLFLDISSSIITVSYTHLTLPTICSV